MVETNNKQMNRYMNKGLLLLAGETGPIHQILTALQLLPRQCYVRHQASVNKNDKNPAPQELTPNAFPVQAPGSPSSLHLGPCSPRSSQGRLLPIQVSAQEHFLRETTPN